MDDRNGRTAYLLTELFKGWDKREQVDEKTILIAVDTESGDRVEFTPASPQAAARYLRFLLKTTDPLFKPATVRVHSPSTHAERPGSILFRMSGRAYDPARRYDRFTVLLHMKFTGEGTHSALSLREHFHDDVAEPVASVDGPAIHDFLRALDTAGAHWKNVAVSAYSGAHSRLHLVKR